MFFSSVVDQLLIIPLLFRSLCRLPNIPQMGVSLQRVNIPVETFVVLAQSPTHVKVIFYNTYCLDVQIKAGGLVLVRDGAISLFNQRKVLEEMQPIQVSADIDSFRTAALVLRHQLYLHDCFVIRA